MRRTRPPAATRARSHVRSILGAISSSGATIRAFAWVDYTPYELRCIGSLVLLGQPERAQQALEFFMHDRRPPGWNQWPEVVYREPRTAKFIGDLPHTWCGSDFLNSVRMMFLYERQADDALVLLAGIPEVLAIRRAYRLSQHANLRRTHLLHDRANW